MSPNLLSVVHELKEKLLFFILTAKCDDVAAVLVHKLLGHSLLHYLLHLDTEREIIRIGEDGQETQIFPHIRMCNTKATYYLRQRNHKRFS